MVIDDGQGKAAGHKRRLEPAQAARLSRVEDEARIEALSPVLLREEIPSRAHQTLGIEGRDEDGRLVLGDDGGVLADLAEVAAECEALARRPSPSGPMWVRSKKRLCCARKSLKGCKRLGLGVCSVLMLSLYS